MKWVLALAAVGVYYFVALEVFSRIVQVGR